MSEPDDAISFARKLRQTQTSFEALMWQLLRNRQVAGAKFRRQHPVGPYTCDFFCHEARVVIECDGSGHASEEGMRHDEIRDGYLTSQGITVLRFSNLQIEHDTQAVLGRIEQALRERSAR